MEQSRVDTKNTSSKKRSQRVQLACLPCRSGKLKCNRDYPVCDQCDKRSRESECVYTEKGLRYNTARHKAESIKAKVDRLESYVYQLKEAKAATAEGATDGESENGSHGVASGNPNERIPPVMGNLKLSETGGSRFVGSGHWESILEDISDVKAYFEVEGTPDQSESDEASPFSASSMTPMDITFSTSPGYTKQDILEVMPGKAEMDRLVATWFNAVDSLRLLLHAPTFQQEYQQFWNNPVETSSAWLALLLAVGSLGAEVSGQPRNDQNDIRRAEDLRRLTAHTVVLADWTKAQRYIIETLLLHVKSLLLKHHDTTRPIWFLHGQVMRLCMQAGYHRDAAHNSSVSDLVCEMRRRVWMFACEYDLLCSYQLGMCSLIDWDISDTAPPRNYLDTDFSLHHMNQPRSDDECTPIRFAMCYFNLAKVFGDIVRASHMLSTPSKTDIDRFRTRLDNIRLQNPDQLKMIPIEQSFMDPPELILDRFRVELLYLKAICVLYRPFLHRATYERESRRCLEAAEDTVRCTISLLETAQPGGQLGRFTIFIARHVHDFNLAAVILCSQLNVQTSPDAANNDHKSPEIRQVLAQACSLWMAAGITSNKARHVVRAIQRFLDIDSKEVNIPTTIEGTNMVADSQDSQFGFANPGFQTMVTNDISANLAPGFAAMDNPFAEYQAPLQLEPDPMLRDLFSSSYAMQTWR